MEFYELMKGAIDTHIHISPDPNRERRLDASEAAIQAREAGMRAVVLKSHAYMTTPLADTVQRMVPDIEVYGGITLNFEVGGLNPSAVEAAGKLKSKLVWMPTFSGKTCMERLNIDGEGIGIVDPSGKILPVLGEILRLIKDYDLTLATGHLSTAEILMLLDEAQSAGIKRIVVNHPLTVPAGSGASIDEQKRMIREGVFIEHCFVTTMPTHDRLDPERISEAIRAVGPEHCIMATDFGQIWNPPPVEGMRMFIETMLRYGITDDEIITMVKKNPARALDLPEG